ncbi:ABC transporter ATP-binding protein [Chitinophaga nivalis]|uniref:ABC transporter ATP-binding protein/permease n=1 Tax=Chitinophaga nivalis TaxID=2991709 RepID=A0ABT3IPF2_9BACT|nr:ABC transporter ATP-binding protein [Chitinophaga nivalis]MCW3464496.1 ABC transporter ATP-binding protein/permease [Chitinophaga nivalis]MCW3485813.1 ABC transporter ATP-binding protein/permease [Chitinophaga nivalis]
MKKDSIWKEYMALFRKFNKYLKPYHRHQLLLLLLLITSSAGALVTPYALKIIIDGVFQKGQYSDLVQILFMLVGVYILRIACTIFIEIIYTKVSSGIIASIQQDMVKCIMHKPIDFFRTTQSGDILYTLQSDVNNIQTSFLSNLVSYLIDLLTVIGITIMLLVLNVNLTVISLLLVPLIVFTLRAFTPLLQERFKKIQLENERLSNFFIEKIRNNRLIKSYNTYTHELNKLRSIHSSIVSANVRSAIISASNSSTLTFLVAIGPIFILAYGGKNVFSGTMTIGALIAYIQYLNKLYSPMVNITNGYNGFSKAIVSMKRVEAYIEAIPDATTPPLTTQDPACENICFEQVSLHINGTAILDNISLQFEKGKIYGLIGPSGSGKSTIINLLCGFMQPTSGKVSIDNEKSIHQLPGWHNRLGLVERENQLFHDSILENVRYGGVANSEEKAAMAIASAQLSGVIDKLPEGWHTMVTDTGGTLSDGQKQRIAIARAMARDNQLIIMDEATASIESLLEKKILEALREQYKDSIIIIVTHRMESMQLMDYIYEIEEGTVKYAGQPASFNFKKMTVTT